MASSPQASCLSDPNFAVICAFLERFAKPCGITYPSFVDLQEMLENIEQVPQELVDLHIKLLRKARKTVFLEKWEKALIKFCHSYSSQDGWEIERFGYKKSRLEVKLRALKMLLEGQFDLNSKFKASINTLESEELRAKPLGRDKLGRIYWLQYDPLLNIRVYREDYDEDSWALVAQDRSSLVNLLYELSGDELSLGSSLQNSESVLEIDKQFIDTGQIDDINFEQKFINSENDKNLISENDLRTDNINTSDSLKEPFKTISLEKGSYGDLELKLQCKNTNESFLTDAESVREDRTNNYEINVSNNENSISNNQNGNSVNKSVDEAPSSTDGVIEEPVMYISGSGCGADCLTGNLDKDGEGEKESEKVTSEVKNNENCNISSHCSSDLDTSAETNSDKQKAVPKLWSIDTICGVSSDKKISDCIHSEDNLENSELKSKQKNFTTFSIDYVLEKKDLSTSDNASISRLATFSCDNSPVRICGSSQSEEYKNKLPIAQSSSNDEMLQKENHSLLSASNTVLDETVNSKLEDNSEASDIMHCESKNECISQIKKNNCVSKSELLTTGETELKEIIFQSDIACKKTNLFDSEASADGGSQHTIKTHSRNSINELSRTEVIKKDPMTSNLDISKPPSHDNTTFLKFSSDSESVSSVVGAKNDQLPSEIEKGTADLGFFSEDKAENTKTKESERTFDALKATVKEEIQSSDLKIISDKENEEMIGQNLLKTEKDIHTDNGEALENTNLLASDSINSENISVSEKVIESKEKEEMTDVSFEGIKKEPNEEMEEQKLFEDDIYNAEEKEVTEKTNSIEKPKGNETEVEENVEKDCYMEDCIGEPIKEKIKMNVENNFKVNESIKDGKTSAVESNSQICHETVLTAEQSFKQMDQCDSKNFTKSSKLNQLSSEYEVDVEKISKDRKQKKSKLPQKILFRSKKTSQDETEDENINLMESKKEEEKGKDEEKEEEVERKNEEKEKEIERENEEKEEEVERENEEKEAEVERENEETEEKEGFTKPVKKEEEEIERLKKEETEELLVQESFQENSLERKSECDEAKNNIFSPSISKGKGFSRRRRRRKNREKLKKHNADVELKEKQEQEEQKEVVEEVVEENLSKKKGRPKKNDITRSGGRPIPTREIKLLGITEVEVEVPSVRQSRRIAQMKMKEEAERRRVEALQLETFKCKKKLNKWHKKKSKKKADSDSYDEKIGVEEESDDFKPKSNKEKKGRKKKRKDKLVFDELNPWLSSSGSSTADEEEEEIEDEAHEDEELIFKSDHEFSPESDVEDPDYKPMKRARTAKVEESKNEAGKYDDTSCEKCGNNDHPEWILLCDKCDKGWHASCVRPALMLVPEGDWYCPPCEHLALIEKLQHSLIQFDRNQKQRENEELRRKRLAFVGISLDNVLPPTKKLSSKIEEAEEKDKNSEEQDSISATQSESDISESDTNSEDEPVYRLRERRSTMTSYRYNEYDELIKSALQDEMDAIKGAGNAGKGKDISNIVNAEIQRKQEDESDEDLSKHTTSLPKDDVTSPAKFAQGENNTPENSMESTRKSAEEKVSCGEIDEERDSNNEEENVIDEVSLMVPKYGSKKKRRSKSVKITSLDFTSEEEDNNSDSDFKGASSEEESDYSLPSESESSIDRRKRKTRDGPLRRSTRPRISRYDRDFINDDSDDSPVRKKNRRSWDGSESSDSDGSWRRKRRRNNKPSQRHTGKKNRVGSRLKKQRFSSKSEDSTSSKKRQQKIRYGGLDSLDEETVLSRRTRGKKINYQEITGSDSEIDAGNRKVRGSRVIDSDDDFVAENEKDEFLQGDSEEADTAAENDSEEEEEEIKDFSKQIATGKNKLIEKFKRKNYVIPDPDDFSENDIAEEEQLNRVTEELGNLGEEDGKILAKILESDVSGEELKIAVNRVKEKKLVYVTEKSKKKNFESEDGKPPFAINSNISQFPKPNEELMTLGEMRMTPNVIKLCEAPEQRSAPIDILKKPQGLEEGLESQPGSLGPVNSSFKNVTSVKTQVMQVGHDGKSVSTVSSNITPLPNLHDHSAKNPDRDFCTNSASTSEYTSFLGIVPPSNISTGIGVPISVPAINLGENQSTEKQETRPGVKVKRKLHDGSLHSESGTDSEDLVFSPRQGDSLSQTKIQNSLTKKKGRGRGKKPLLDETQTKIQNQGKQDDSVVQSTQNQFAPKNLPDEGESVISRILNNPQGTQAYPFGCNPNRFSSSPRNRPQFTPSLPSHFPGTPRPLSTLRLRPLGPGGSVFHAPHPLDPSPSGGGPINISISNSGMPKPAALPPFNRAALAVMPPRFASDMLGRQLYSTRNSPPGPEFSFSNYYSNFQQGESSIPDGSAYQNPGFQEQSFSEDMAITGVLGGKQFEDESGGEFGGLASYFASQRENDLDT